MGKQSKYFVVNENFVKLRKSLGLTQEEFSSVLKIKRSLLGAYEEHRAEVKSVVIKYLIRKEFLSPNQLYKFLFMREYKPTPKHTYKKTWVRHVNKIKSSS